MWFEKEQKEDLIRRREVTLSADLPPLKILIDIVKLSQAPPPRSSTSISSFTAKTA